MKGVIKIVWLVGVLLSIAAAVFYYLTNEASKKQAQTAAARAARWRKEPEPEPESEPEPEQMQTV
jgi:flagellar basal body-associated protein FliL